MGNFLYKSLQQHILESRIKDSVKIKEMTIVLEYYHPDDMLNEDKTKPVKEYITLSQDTGNIFIFISKYASIFLMDEEERPKYPDNPEYDIGAAYLYITYNNKGCFTTDDGFTFYEITKEINKTLCVRISDHLCNMKNENKKKPLDRTISFTTKKITRVKPNRALRLAMGIDEFVYKRPNIIKTPYELASYKIIEIDKEYFLEKDRNGAPKEYKYEVTIENIVCEALHIYPFNIIL